AAWSTASPSRSRCSSRASPSAVRTSRRPSSGCSPRRSSRRPAAGGPSGSSGPSGKRPPPRQISRTADDLVDLSDEVDPDRDHVRGGGDDAAVTLVEYGD